MPSGESMTRRTAHPSALSSHASESLTRGPGREPLSNKVTCHRCDPSGCSDDPGTGNMTPRPWSAKGSRGARCLNQVHSLGLAICTTRFSLLVLLFWGGGWQFSCWPSRTDQTTPTNEHRRGHILWDFHSILGPPPNQLNT